MKRNEHAWFAELERMTDKTMHAMTGRMTGWRLDLRFWQTTDWSSSCKYNFLISWFVPSFTQDKPVNFPKRRFGLYRRRWAHITSHSMWPKTKNYEEIRIETQFNYTWLVVCIVKYQFEYCTVRYTHRFCLCCGSINHNIEQRNLEIKFVNCDKTVKFTKCYVKVGCCTNTYTVSLPQICSKGIASLLQF